MSNRNIISVFIALSAIYLLEVFFIPPDTATLTKFDISEAKAKLLTLTIALPIIAIWMIGCYVYTRFKSYAESIAGDKDGNAFAIIRAGLLPLFLWLPISVTFSSMATYLYHRHPSWTVPMVIINNYLNLIFIIIGFYLIHKGTSKLIRMKDDDRASSWKYAANVPLVIISLIFIFLSLNNPARQFPTYDTPIAAYYLPDWLLVATVLLPYILVFYYGFFAVLNLYIFRVRVRGVIYKNAVEYFAKGLLCIVTSIIFIRYLTNLTTIFTNATLKFILLILYLLIVLLLLGFIMLIKSVKKLQDIEKA